VKLAVLAKPDMLSEVVDRQRLTSHFVVSSGHAKLSRLKFLIPGSLVRVQPGVLQKLAGTMPAFPKYRRCPSKVTPEGEGLAWSRPADQAMEVSGKARADVETTTR